MFNSSLRAATFRVITFLLLISRVLIACVLFPDPRTATEKVPPCDAKTELAAKLALQSETLQRDSPADLETSALLAAESLIANRSASGDFALRSALSLLRHPLFFIEHSKPINSVSASQDGSWIATASEDGTAKIYALSSGRLVATLNHQHGISAITFSPDSKLVVTASWDSLGLLKLPPTGEPQLIPVRGVILSMAVANHIVAVGTTGNVARLFDVNTRQEVAHFDRKEGIRAVALDAEGRLLATAGGKSVRILSIASKTEMFRPLIQGGSVRKIAFNSGGNLLATASDDGVAHLYNTQTGEPFGPPLLHAGPVELIAFSEDGSLLATKERDGTIHVFSVANECRELARIPRQATATAIAFASNRGSLVTANSDHTVHVFDALSNREIMRLVEQGPVAGVSITYQPVPILVAAGGTVAHVVEITRGHWISTPLGQNKLGRAAFSSNGKLVIADEAVVHTFDAANGAKLNPDPTPDYPVSILAYSPNGTFLVMAKEHASTEFIELFNGQNPPVRLAVSSDFDRRPVAALSFSSDNTSLAVAGSNTQSPGGDQAFVQIYDPRTLKPIGPPRTRSGQARSVAVSLGRRLTALGTSNEAYIFQGTRELHRFLPGEAISAITFSPNGEFVALGTESGEVRVFTTADGNQVFAEAKHGSAVISVLFNANGHTLASLTAAGILRIFDLKANAQIARLSQQGVKAFAFTGAQLVALSVDNEGPLLQTHPIERIELLQQACNILTRNLSVLEWGSFIGKTSYEKTCKKLP